MNAKLELLSLCTRYNLTIKAANISYAENFELSKVINLKVFGDGEELTKFLNELDFDYDNGFGTQHISGIVWFMDGTWAERGEYDGSEWWNHCMIPEIPLHLL